MLTKFLFLTTEIYLHKEKKSVLAHTEDAITQRKEHKMETAKWINTGRFFNQYSQPPDLLGDTSFLTGICISTFNQIKMQ